MRALENAGIKLPNGWNDMEWAEGDFRNASILLHKFALAALRIMEA